MACGWIARKLVGAAVVADDTPATRVARAMQTYRHPERALALCLGLARACMIVLLVWAAAAGTWRAMRRGEMRDDALRLVDPDWLALTGGAVFYAAGALGAVALILLAAAVVGGAFGFLFGLPRMDGRVVVMQAAGTEAAARTDGGAAGAGAGAAAAPAAKTTAATGAATPALAGGERTTFRMSPALNEIADWLTKIIVGLGLVQAGAIASGFRDIVDWLLGPVGLSRFPVAGAVVPASMLIGLIGGFMLVYMVMTLVMGRELADAALDLDAQARRAQEDAEAQRRADDAAAQREAVRHWSGQDLNDLLNRGRDQPPLPLTGAAKIFGELDFGALQTREEKRAWIAINAARGQMKAASEAFNALQGLDA